MSVPTQTHRMGLLTSVLEILQWSATTLLWRIFTDRYLKSFLPHAWLGQSKSVRGARNKIFSIITSVLFPHYQGYTAACGEVMRSKKTRELKYIIGIQTNFWLFIKTKRRIIWLIYLGVSYNPVGTFVVDTGSASMDDVLAKYLVIYSSIFREGIIKVAAAGNFYWVILWLKQELRLWLFGNTVYNFFWYFSCLYSSHYCFCVIGCFYTH